MFMVDLPQRYQILKLESHLLLDTIVLRRRTELRLDIGPVESIDTLTFGAEKLILDSGNDL
jgi:hypothetical protein